MTEPSSWIVAEADESALSPRLLGGKGSVLLRLRALGFPVPPTVVVTTTAFLETLGRSPWLAGAVEELEKATVEELPDTSGRVAQHLRDAGCPTDLERRLAPTLLGLAAGGVTWAVRSSAPAEDSGGSSFAGLLESRLNVPASQVGDSVVGVWASSFAPRVVAYRRRRGLPLDASGAAVVIQPMVDAVAAGVLFTRDPVASQDDAVVIVASHGLGEGVVQGTVGSETLRVERRGNALERVAGDQREEIVAAPGGGTQRRELPRDCRGRAVLSDAEALRLRDLGLALEDLLGGPQDVEWALDRRRRLVLLQSRPALARGNGTPGRAADDEERLWDNSNVAESYPGLTLPLTFSFARVAYERAFRRAATVFFPIGNPLARQAELFANLVGLVQGRVYYNLGSWYSLFGWLARPDRHRESWDRLVGIRADPSGPIPTRIVHPVGIAGSLARLQAALSAACVLLRVRANGRRFDARAAAFFARHAAAASEPTSALLAARYRRIDREASSFWHLTLFNDLCALRYVDWLTRRCRQAAPEQPDLAARLLAGGGGLPSVRPLRSLAGLADEIAREPALRLLLAKGDYGAAWAAIQRDPEHAGLRRAFDDHLAAYGDRATHELKLESLTFRDAPLELLAAIRGALDGGVTMAGIDVRCAGLRRDSQAALGHVVGGHRRLLLRVLQAPARRALHNREAMRLARGRLFGLVRGVFRALGERLEAAGAIDDRRDVFYLTVDEVLAYVEGTSVTADLRPLVRLRRSEYESFALADPPPRFRTRGIPGLDPPPRRADPSSSQTRLRGVGCSAGTATGPALVVEDPRRSPSPAGGILVARTTDPGWIYLMMSSAGLVAERGSVLSHTAIIGRELGIPTVVGAVGAVDLVPDGARLTIDGGSGEVSWSEAKP